MLHVISKTALIPTCLQLKAAEDILLLIEEAVTQITNLKEVTNVYALKEDVEAKGLINHVPSEINLVDYAGFVDLVINYSPVQSWY